MDFGYYKKLLSFRSHSQSKAQVEFRNWLMNEIEILYPEASVWTDDYGNLYVEKGDTEGLYVNCVVAHLDINQKKIDGEFKIVIEDNRINGYDEDGNQIGLGHDDKAGVYFALQALRQFEEIKCVFTLDEEVGLIGTSNLNFSFFDNVGFLVQLDRRGNSDISYYTNGIQVLSDYTMEELKPIVERYSYDYESCVCTDVGDIVYETSIQGCNISCGYINEHRDTETLDIAWYRNAEAFALALLNYTNGKRFML